MTESTKRTSEEANEQTHPVPTGSRLLPRDDAWHGLVRLAYRFVWNLDDAEDAVQEALLAAEAHRTQLRESTKWWNWLCRIVVQKCHAQGRQRAQRRRHMRRFQLEVSATGKAHADLSAETLAVRSILPELPPRQRDVLVLRHLQGLDDSDVAEILDIAPATVRVHAKAARESLTALLKQRHPDWFDTNRKA